MAGSNFLYPLRVLGGAKHVRPKDFHLPNCRIGSTLQKYRFILRALWQSIEETAMAGSNFQFLYPPRVFCSKMTLFCAYPRNELCQTLFLRRLQAIPPKSSVGTGKIPVLADCPYLAPWSNFFFFPLARKRRCPALTHGPTCTKLGFLGFWRSFHQNQALELVKCQ